MAGIKRCKDCLAEGITTTRKTPHPGPRCSSHHRVRRALTRNTSREARLKALYGLSQDEYDQVKEYQQGVCAICQRANGSVRALAVDHDHASGIVRGCLCKYDNRLLGFARDDIEYFQRAIDYLTNPPAVQVLGERVVPGQLASGAGVARAAIPDDGDVT